jgi:hypothetical protein
MPDLSRIVSFIPPAMNFASPIFNQADRRDIAQCLIAPSRSTSRDPSLPSSGSSDCRTDTTGTMHRHVLVYPDYPVLEADDRSASLNVEPGGTSPESPC